MRTIYGPNRSRRTPDSQVDVTHKTKSQKWYSTEYLASVWAKRPAKLLALLGFVAIVTILLAVFAAGPETASNTTTSGPYSLTNPEVPYVQPMPFPLGGAFRRNLSTAALDPNSSKYVKFLNNLVATKGSFVQNEAYAENISIAAASTPLVPVVEQYSQTSLATAFAQGVPFPANAVPDTGTDGYLSVYQPSNHKFWEMWRASTPQQNAPGAGPLPWGEASHGDSKWHTVWGGIIADVANNPGYFDMQSLPGLSQNSWGSSATSLVNAARAILVSEAKSGHINHAVAIAEGAPTNCATLNNWPAQRNDGSGATGSCIPEGTFFRLDPKLDLSTISMSPFAHMVAVAAQKYGMCVCEGTSGGTSLQIERSAQYGFDAWGTLLAPYHRYDAMHSFPWASLQAVQSSTRTLNNPSPTTSTTTATTGTPTVTSGTHFFISVHVTSADKRPTLGAVYLVQNSKKVGMKVLDANGRATFNVLAGATGAQSYTVEYGGDELLKASTAPTLSVTVN